MKLVSMLRELGSAWQLSLLLWLVSYFVTILPIKHLFSSQLLHIWLLFPVEILSYQQLWFLKLFSSLGSGKLWTCLRQYGPCSAAVRTRGGLLDSFWEFINLFVLCTGMEIKQEYGILIWFLTGNWLLYTSWGRSCWWWTTGPYSKYVDREDTRSKEKCWGRDDFRLSPSPVHSCFLQIDWSWDIFLQVNIARYDVVVNEFSRMYDCENDVTWGWVGHGIEGQVKTYRKSMRVYWLLLPTFSEKLLWIMTIVFTLICLTIFILDFSGLATSFGCKSACTASNRRHW